jgi:predicted ATPase
MSCDTERVPSRVVSRPEEGRAVAGRSRGPDHRSTCGRRRLLSVVELLAEDAPVLAAIDDLQWLDPSSRNVIAFTARRLSARVGVFGTVRSDPDEGRGAASWLQLPQPDGVRRLHIRPLSLGGLNTVITERLGRSLSRPAIVRIQEVSGGNPFYALELARAMNGDVHNADMPLPMTLT